MVPGTVVANRFVIVRPVALGGMAKVYQATDRETGGLVALKVIGVTQADDVARFVREAQILSQLRHPGIVSYLADGHLADGETYLAMEWLEGEDLGARLGRGPLSIADSVLVVRRAAEALAAAHDAGLVHRDIKPQNIFLVDGHFDHVKVLDFGIARFLDATQALTRSGTLLGTPCYMAPEQARDEPIEARADVFALGCVLHECLTGRQAFAAETLWAVLTKILFEEVPPVGQLRQDVPPALDSFVKRLLAKDPERRPADAGEVAFLLGETLSEDSTVDETPAVAMISGSEQRIVSVVVCADQSRGGLLDEGDPTMRTPPDELAAEQSFAQAVAPFGARLEHLADGTIVALLSGSGPATDLAARAARCALVMRGLRGQAPMALATGRGVVSGKWPIGEVVDRAARLLRGARAQAICLDHVTTALLDARFEVAEALGASELLAEREPVAASRTLLGKPTPFVGRERELLTLEAFYAECAAEQVARAVILIGAPGIGKSRLRYELVRRLEAKSDPCRIWIARGDPMRAGSPFGLAGALVRRGCGILDGDPAAARPGKLRARARELGLPLTVAEFLGEIAASQFIEGSVELAGARRDTRLMSEQIHTAFVAWLGAECGQSPVVLILEDLHWGDLPTIKLVETALRQLADQPLFILATARPEVRDVFPRLHTGGVMHVMQLGQVSRRAAQRLVRDVLGQSIDEGALVRIVERADGNPFFLEELIRTAAQGGAELPETVLATLQLRVTGMEDEARQVLRAASIFGQVFWLSGVAALVGDALAPRVRSWTSLLVDREIASRRSSTRFAGEDELVFRHALVREAAYATLTDDDRVLGHRLAAAWLEEMGDPDAVSLAEHWERGQMPARAAPAFRRAAEAALEGDDLEAAARLAARGVASGQDVGGLLLLQAEAMCWRGDFAPAQELARRALEALPRGGDEWYHALELAAHMAGVTGESTRLAELAAVVEETVGAGAGGPAMRAAAVVGTRLVLEGKRGLARAIADRFAGDLARVSEEDPAAAAHLLKLQSFLAASGGDWGAELELAEASRQAFARAGGQRAACFQQVNVGEACLRLGDFARAEGLFRDALVVAGRLGLTAVVAWIQQNLGVTLGALGRLTEAREVETASAETYREIGERPMESASRSHLSTVLLASGDVAGAEEQARRALALASEPTRLLPRRALALAALANALRVAGRADEAKDAGAEGVALLAEMEVAHENEGMIRLANVEASGDPEVAKAAREWLTARGELIGDPAARRQYLEGVPENAKILRAR